MKDFIIYQENLFENFMEIPPYDYREKMQFYLEYQEVLLKMDEPYFMRIRMDYLEALFFLGQYPTFLAEVRHDLVYVIRNNIKYFEGKDIFRWLLVLKGAALYNTEQYAQSAEIFKQLIRMFPAEIKLKWYLYRALYQMQWKRMKWLNRSVVWMLSGVVVLSLVELFIGMKWPALLQQVQMARNGMLLGGLATLVLSFGYRIIRTQLDAVRMVKK